MLKITKQATHGEFMIKAKGYAAKSETSPLEPFAFERRMPGSQDVQIEILYCGICHSDLHMARNEWQVKEFKEGDIVAVGCLVDSCRHCHGCQDGLEQYCETGFTLTYNSPEKETGGMTYGGYSDSIVVSQDFVLKVPGSLDIKAVAPLLCAGITTYSPLRHWKVKKGDKVGVVGLGGL